MSSRATDEPDPPGSACGPAPQSTGRPPPAAPPGPPHRPPHCGAEFGEACFLRSRQKMRQARRPEHFGRIAAPRHSSTPESRAGKKFRTSSSRAEAVPIYWYFGVRYPTMESSVLTALKAIPGEVPQKQVQQRSNHPITGILRHRLHSLPWPLRRSPALRYPGPQFGPRPPAPPPDPRISAADTPPYSPPANPGRTGADRRTTPPPANQPWCDFVTQPKKQSASPPKDSTIRRTRTPPAARSPAGDLGNRRRKSPSRAEMSRPIHRTGWGSQWGSPKRRSSAAAGRITMKNRAVKRLIAPPAAAAPKALPAPPCGTRSSLPAATDRMPAWDGHRPPAPPSRCRHGPPLLLFEFPAAAPVGAPAGKPCRQRA